MLGKKTLLLVEDESAILLSVQRILELTGNFEVFAVSNGKEALKITERVIPDLIISDIAMPEMDGIELCKKIRQMESTRAIPFIFLTAKKNRILEGIQTGSDDFVIKPFQVEELLAKINAIFRRIEMSREQAQLQKGNLTEYPLDELLHLCTTQSISGEIILQNKGEECHITLERGDITKVSLKDLSEDAALDTVRQWQEGTFILRSRTLNLKINKSGGSEKNSDEYLTDAVEIAPQSWWVGRRNPHSMLQMNVYLRRFTNNKRCINYLIDPGSPFDFSIISKKAAAIIGDIANVHIYSINHQNPDVAMNALFLKKLNPKAICLTTEANWHMLIHYEINPKSVKLIDELKNLRLKLVTDNELIYIPSPYCCAKGAFLTYDPQARVLYSGKLFSGICDQNENDTLYAGEDHWNGVKAFHQLYMPSNKAIRYILNQIERLKPYPKMIAPQHGAIIKGTMVPFFMDKLHDLPVGADLLDIEVTPELELLYLEALNEIFLTAQKLLPKEALLKKIKSDPEFSEYCTFNNKRIVKILRNPEEAIQKEISFILKQIPAGDIPHLKSTALRATVKRNLPVPSFDWEHTETISLPTKEIFHN
jgi:CheY-like chemotaxis protein